MARAAPAPDPFYEFAMDSETDLRSMRAKLFACHVLLEPRSPPNEETLDAIYQLVMDSLNHTTSLIRAHTAAYEAARAAADMSAAPLTPPEHEHTAAIDEAASWLARQRVPPSPAMLVLRSRFGLSAVDACAAIREATLKRGRAM